MPLCGQDQGQDLISNNVLPIEIIANYTPEEVEHLVHGIEHHVMACPSPFLVA